MTPGARVAAAAELLDRVLDGAPVERTLTNWARGSRFAGSSDRAAVRDLVFDALRRRRSAAAMGGAGTGRGVILGLIRQRGQDPAALFTGSGHAPAPLTAVEATDPPRPDDLPELVALDCPDWLAPELRRSLGARFAPVLNALRDRAPVWLRVNRARATRHDAATALAAEGIETRPHPGIPEALEIVTRPRGLRASRAFRDGLVELQDIAPQQAMASLSVEPGMRILDYCAGGGGKALALAARVSGAHVFAHDAAPRRMADLPARAARAGAAITLLAPGGAARAGPFDLVLCDVPCSGSGAWRREPEAKWRLTAEGLDRLRRVQADIIDRAARLVAPGGMLAYASCSLMLCENDDQVAAFLDRNRDWRDSGARRFLPPADGDGFFLALLTRPAMG